MVGKITNYLIETQTPISKVKTYSKLPGIYAFFFIGKDFPIDGFKVPDNKIIYIGKTESSQQSRDANTHFKTGRTGSSTVRKTTGAILSQTEQITPVIRSASNVVKGRTSHYKYDKVSEERITEWMFENLAVAFYEYPQGKDSISILETSLIQYLKPVLNIDSASAKEYKTYIKKLRKDLGTIAHTNYIREHSTLGMKLSIEIPPSKKEIIPNSISVGKYVQIWQQYSDEIQKALTSKIIQNTIQLDRSLFEKVGNRKSYSFRLQYINEIVSNNIGGSAVARDLHKYLSQNNICPDNKTFRLHKDLKLIIENS